MCIQIIQQKGNSWTAQWLENVTPTFYTYTKKTKYPAFGEVSTCHHQIWTHEGGQSKASNGADPWPIWTAKNRARQRQLKTNVFKPQVQRCSKFIHISICSELIVIYPNMLNHFVGQVAYLWFLSICNHIYVLYIYILCMCFRMF